MTGNLTGSATALALALFAAPLHAAFPSGQEAIGFVRFPVRAGTQCGTEVDLQAPGMTVIHVAWMRHGGADGPMGCPVSSQGDPASHFEVTFQNGTIVTDVRIWPKGYLAAYQDWKGLFVDWAIDALAGPGSGPPVGLHFEKFLVRWEEIGAAADQIDVSAEGELDTHLWTKGTQHLPVKDPETSPGIYRVAVKGCNGSDCPQDWLGPAPVVMIWPAPAFNRLAAVNLAGVEPATSVGMSQRLFFARASRAIQQAACGQLLPWTNFHNEHGSAVIVLAKIAYAEVFATDRCPGRDVDNRAEASAWLLTQRVESASGTTLDGLVQRTGEYDTALIGWVAMMYAFGDKLAPNVYDHVLDTLLNKSGPVDPADFTVTAGAIPETENHLLNIQSSRYLTNQLLCDRARARQLPEPGSCDNERNGMNAWLLSFLQPLLFRDFIEYNSNPYQGYSLMSLLNLASYARDERVKTAAQMVLDYVFVKGAVSTDRLRRSVPYRRKAEYYRETFFREHTDPMVGFLAQLAGNTELVPAPPGNEMLWAAISEYRIPPPVLDIVLERRSRTFYQVFNHITTELYFGSPGYTISAGGGHTAGAYQVLGISNSDDRGLDVATIFLPAERALFSREQAFRFGKLAPMEENGNFCVAPNFACGSQLIVPRGYPIIESRQEGSWTFIRDGERFGYYLALFDRDGVALLEAYDLSKEGNTLSFDEFVAHVRKDNDDTVWRAAEARPIGGGLPVDEPVNRYVTADGTVIEFVSRPMPRIVTINGVAPFDGRGIASGSVADSEGQRGLIKIHNPAPSSRYAECELVLDFRNAQAPPIREMHGPLRCSIGDPPGFEDKPLCDPVVYVPAPDAPGEALSQRWGDQGFWEDDRIHVQLQDVVAGGTVDGGAGAPLGRLQVRRYQVHVTEQVRGGGTIEVSAEAARITQAPTLQYQQARYAPVVGIFADNARIGAGAPVRAGGAPDAGGAAAPAPGPPGGPLAAGGSASAGIREPGSVYQRQWRFDRSLGISLERGIRLEVDMMCDERLTPRVYTLRYLRSDAEGRPLVDVMLKHSQPRPR